MLKTRLQIKQAPVYDFISVINYVRLGHVQTLSALIGFSLIYIYNLLDEEH